MACPVWLDVQSSGRALVRMRTCFFHTHSRYGCLFFWGNGIHRKFMCSMPVQCCAEASSTGHLQILTSKLPLPTQPVGRGVMEIMTCGHVLNQPTEIIDPLWKLLLRCWLFDSGERPPMATVTAELTII